MKTQFKTIDEYAQQHGTSDLKGCAIEIVEIAFKLGILAGAIFSDAPRESVDRFERGLAFDLSVTPRLSKTAS